LVVLEPLAELHASDLAAAAADGELFTWMPANLGASPEQVRDWITDAGSARQQRPEVPFAIIAKASGRAVGSTRFLELRPEHLRVEIGWTWVAQSVWRTGVNVEAKLLLLTHAFERIGLRRVEFKTDARNARSRGALEALGAKFEGVLRKHMVVHNGAPRDSAYYSVIDDEWLDVKALLERRLEQHLRLSGT
jgi:RimJ/RimL family protein N-acetyltransferase